MRPVRVTPLGSMDKDSDLQLIAGGNYTDAHDIRHRDLAGNRSINVTNFKGNALKVELAGIGASVKQYRIYIDVSAAFSQAGVVTPPSGTITLFDNQDTPPVATVSATINPIDLEDYYDKLIIQLTTLGTHTSPFTYGALVPTGDYTGYFTLVADEVTDPDFTLTGTGNLVDNFMVISEGYSVTGGTQQQKIIGSVEVDKDLFIVSATPAAFDTGGSAFTISELGVVVFDESNDTYTYTRLLRTKTWGLTWDFGVQMKAEKNGDRISLYLTDRNVVPRAVYVNKPYATDGAIDINGGDYNYQTINEETYLFVRTPTATLTINEVVEGGSLTAGNKRYTGRFLTDSLVGSEYIYPTGIVNIGLGSPEVAHEIRGGAPGEVTTKQVKMTLSNIPQGVFKFFELVAIEYSGESIGAVTVQRYSLADNTEIEVSHTDLGQDNATVAFSEILALFSKYDTVGSLELVNNRLVVSNVTEEQDEDLNEWAAAITHSLEQTTIPAVDLLRDPTQSSPGYAYGEYQDPNNVLNFTSYMFGDTYRFGVQVKWKSTGRWSKPYWVDDIRFDLEAENVTDDRRTANNIDTNMTDEETKETKVYYVKFGNIDLDYAVGSNSLYQIIDAVRFVRAERIPEVIATGIFLMGMVAGGGTIHPFPYPIDITTYAGLTDTSNFVFFHSPDIYYGNTQYVYQDGDTVRLMGPAKFSKCFKYTGIKASSSTGGHYNDQTGYFDDQSVTPIDFEEFSVSDHLSLSQGVIKNIGADAISTEFISGSTKYSTSHCHDVFKLETTVFGDVGSAAMMAADPGVHYGMVFRDRGANLKYPVNKELTVYHTANHLRYLTAGETGVITEDIYGGDVFTQKTHSKIQSTYYLSPAPNDGSGVGFYSQNVMNTQMRTIEDQSDEFGGFGYVYPQSVDKSTTLGGSPTYLAGAIGRGLANWLEQWPERVNQRSYNKGYNWRDGSITEHGFDPNSTYTGERRATITWSAQKTVGSRQDNYRIFKPADFSDLDITKGEIEFHCELNGALYTWQRESFQRQYFNDPTTIGADEGTDVIVGTGSILGLRGQEISSIGSDKKWCVVKGKNPNGKDIAYWYNDNLRKIMRFGADGPNPISERRITSYLRTYANFLTDKEEPISGMGVHGVWNDRYDEVIFTFKSFSDAIAEYAGPGAFDEGDLVWNSDAPIGHASGLPWIYRAKAAFTVVSDAQTPGTGVDTDDYWDELGPEDLPEYYTLFTIAWDEAKNGFESFHQYHPNIYMPWLGNFGSADPLNPDQLWMHDTGPVTSYYGTGYQASITSVLNDEPNVSKIFEASQWVSDILPFRVEFTTANHTSFLTEDDFESREDFFYSTIKNNAVSGVVTGDSSRLFGRYLLSKFIFETAVEQRLMNYIIKTRPNSRLYNR